MTWNLSSLSASLAISPRLRHAIKGSHAPQVYEFIKREAR